MDIISLIEKLEKELSKGKDLEPDNHASFNFDKCLGLLEDLKGIVPEDVQEASKIIAEKNEIISKAKESAEKTIKDAEAKAENILSETEIVKQSEEEAENIIESANKKSNQLFCATKESVDKLLKSVEDYLQQNLNIVRNNRDELNNSSFNCKK